MTDSDPTDGLEVDAVLAASASEAERNFKLTRLSIIIGFTGAVIGVAGTLVAATMSNAATSSEMRQQFQQEQRIGAYTDLISSSDVNAAAFSKIIAGSYWSLQGKDDSSQDQKTDNYDAWYASELSLSHATTKVTMVGSKKESELALAIWKAYSDGRNAYQKATTPEEVSTSGRNFRYKLSQIRSRFIAVATTEMGGGQ